MSGAVLVLMRPRAAAPPPPTSMAYGRAALALASEGIEVVVGAAGVAWKPTPGGWTRADLGRVTAVFDRFPSRTWPDEYPLALAGLEHLPLANAPGLQALCWDKVACQRLLEAEGVPMPPLVDEPAAFADALAAWGVAFYKPREGKGGQGVRRVVTGEPLPSAEGALLQRAVPPPAGAAGLCLRALVQRSPAGGWLHSPMVARVSATDPVAAVERGARALPAEEVVSARTLALAREAVDAAAAALARHHEPAVELGLDLVVDAAGAPHLIEVNGRPGGLLRALVQADPARWEPERLAACTRPIRALALRLPGGAQPTE